MPAMTPSWSVKLSLGNRVGVLGKFTSVANADYWDTGLGTVEAIFITNSVSGVTSGATYSGGRATIASSAGLTTCLILAVGLP